MKTDSSLAGQEIYSPNPSVKNFKNSQTESIKVDLHKGFNKQKNIPKLQLDGDVLEVENNTTRLIEETVENQSKPESHIGKSSNQTHKFSEESKPEMKPVRHLSEIEQYYATLTVSYMEKLNQMSKFNKAVCLFKNKKLDDSIKIWETLNISPDDEKNGKNHFPICSLFNLAISHYLKNNYETSIDLTQELITKICNQSQDTPEGLELQAELEFIGSKDLKTKCLKLLKYLEEEMGV